eukprot:tig00021181_g19310.t1
MPPRHNRQYDRRSGDGLPIKTGAKKGGEGAHNWGKPGDELMEMADLDADARALAPDIPPLLRTARAEDLDKPAPNSEPDAEELEYNYQAAGPPAEEQASQTDHAGRQGQA